MAESLTAQDVGVAWSATAPGALTPELSVDGGGATSLPRDAVVGAVAEHLRSAPPAWDPLGGADDLTARHQR